MRFLPLGWWPEGTARATSYPGCGGREAVPILPSWVNPEGIVAHNTLERVARHRSGTPCGFRPPRLCSGARTTGSLPAWPSPLVDPFVHLHRIDENAAADVAPVLAYLREQRHPKAGSLSASIG